MGLGLSVKLPLGYLLNDAPGSPMSPPRGRMGGSAFIIARPGTVYVTPGPYLPIAKSRSEGLGLSVKRSVTCATYTQHNITERHVRHVPKIPGVL